MLFTGKNEKQSATSSEQQSIKNKSKLNSRQQAASREKVSHFGKMASICGKAISAARKSVLYSSYRFATKGKSPDCIFLNSSICILLTTAN